MAADGVPIEDIMWFLDIRRLQLEQQKESFRALIIAQAGPDMPTARLQ